MIEPLNW